MVEPLEFIFEGDSREAERAFDRVGRATGKTEKKTRSLSERLRDLTVIGFGAVRSLRSISNTLGDVFSATDRQLQADAKLAVAIAKNTNETFEAVRALKSYASELQSVTTFGDEFIQELAAIGLELGVPFELVGDAVEGALDRVSGGTSRSAIEVMRQLGRFAGGASDSLRELGVVVDEDADRTTQLEQALDQMRNGLSRAVAELPTAKLTQLGNTLGDVKEKIGEVITSTASFQSVRSVLQSFAKEIDDALSDPEKFAEFVEGIDKFIQGFLQAVAKFGAFVLRIVAQVLEAIETMANAAREVLIWLTGNELNEHISNLESELASLEGQTANTAAEQFALTDAIEGVKHQLAGARAQLAATTQEFDFASDAIFDAADSLEMWGNLTTIFLEKMRLAPDILQKVFEAMRAVHEEQREGIELSQQEQEDLEAFLAFQATVIEQLEGFGQDFTTAFSFAVQDALDEDTGIEEAFRNLGDDIKTIFIGQFTEAAFAPVKVVFGQLAVALRQPFEVVGNLINRILAPVTNLISQVISTLITQFFSLIGLQELLVGTGLAGIATVAAGAAPLASVWGAAATAASIATLGAATGFAAPAQAAIVTGAGLAKALSIPGLAEGGIVLPSPGGTIVQVAEAGQAEAIIPLDKAGPLGGNVNVDVTIESAQFQDEDQAEGLISELGAEFARQIFDLRDFNVAGSLAGGRT